MKRRQFLQQSILAGTAIATTTNAFSSPSNYQELAITDKPFQLDYAFHAGMFKNHAGENFTDQIRWAYDRGFRSIEDNGMMGRSADEQKKIGDLLAQLGMRMGVFVITSDNWHWKTSLTSGKKEWVDRMIKDCKKQ